MVIGNDLYPPKYSNLTGAIADADHFETYLKGPLAKLSGHEPKILSLRNAKRQQILDGFSHLQTKYTELKDKAAIVIFYAGHGARTRKPKEWIEWKTSNDEIELLCPSDIGTIEDGSVVEGIYDRTISALLNQLSEAMGSNITLIMDCCSSGGITRSDEELEDRSIREIFDPPPARAESDEEIWRRSYGDARGGSAAQGFSGQLYGSHVLLAACGPDEPACESRVSKRGLFSMHLLEILEKEDISNLTYTSLMHKFHLPYRRQTPRCEGHAVNGRLFNNQDCGSDWSFILTHCNNNVITLDAGEAQGITPGSILSFHTSNLTDSPVRGRLLVKDVRMFSSTLKVLPPEPHFDFPEFFYSKVVTTAGSNTSIYCDDRMWLKTVFPLEYIKQAGIVLAKKGQIYDLELVVSGGKVSFHRQHKLVTSHLEKRIRHEVDANDTDTIRRAVCSSRTFYYHLTRRVVDKSEQACRIELTKLGPEYTTSSEEPALVPAGPNIIESEPTTLVVDESIYGMTIYNESAITLYPFVFYFDPTDLTIEEWYPAPFSLAGGGSDKSATGNSNQTVNPPLLPHSWLTIGHGASSVWPWGFLLQENVKKDLGFFRVFLSTHPTPSFFSMKQTSPFPASDIERGGGKREPRLASYRGPSGAPIERCGSRLVTIVQVDSER
ncbi:hypothetical protein NLJ89_g335 [Agrocybe chaxingu]|uniref:Peptidase C14 caspase domain-containing protein n=1 Tax=Agrocybe chaxingu TaxID=84603 RepID=A0A9W8TGL8_9AGAR|nr:hypothetical protein NLJ89_g335 [Agrocybe chaxingu]